MEGHWAYIPQASTLDTRLVGRHVGGHAGSHRLQCHQHFARSRPVHSELELEEDRRLQLASDARMPLVFLWCMGVMNAVAHCEGCAACRQLALILAWG